MLGIYLVIISFTLLSSYFVIRYPSIYPYIFLCATPLYLADYEGLNLPELIYFSLFAMFIIFYVAKNYFLLKINIDYNFEYLIIVLQFFVIYGALLGYLNDAPLSKLVTDPAYFIGLFTYFGYKNTGSDKLKYILYISLLIIVFVVVRNFVDYQEILMQAYSPWQAEKARVTNNELLILIGLNFSILSLLLYRDYKILSFLGVLVMSVAMIITQSRGYWIATIISIITIFFIVDKKYKIRIITLLAGLVAVSVIVLYNVNNVLYNLILSGLYERVTDISISYQDTSLLERYYETKVVISEIMRNPIAGYGLGATYLREFVFAGFSKQFSFIHNGYLAIWFKMGIFAVLTFISLYLINIYNSYKLFKYYSDIDKIINGTMLVTLISMLVVNNTSPQFLSFDGLYVLTIFTLLITHYKNKSINNTHL